ARTISRQFSSFRKLWTKFPAQRSRLRRGEHDSGRTVHQGHDGARVALLRSSCGTATVPVQLHLLAAASITAGVAASLPRDGIFSLLGAGLGLLMLVSFVFWKLDQRTSFLIKHAETAIIELEDSLPVRVARVMTREPVRTAAKEQGWWFSRMWTCGTVFRF